MFCAAAVAKRTKSLQNARRSYGARFFCRDIGWGRRWVRFFWVKTTDPFRQ